VGASVFAGG